MLRSNERNAPDASSRDIRACTVLRDMREPVGERDHGRPRVGGQRREERSVDRVVAVHIATR